MKYIRYYKNLNDYIQNFKDIKEQKYCISFVNDEDLMLGGDEQKKTIYVKTKEHNAWIGDILCWNTNTNDFEVYHVTDHSDDATLNDLKNKSYLIPDSICVVPSCHTNNGKAKWCALKDASDSNYSQTSDNPKWFQIAADTDDWDLFKESLNNFDARENFGCTDATYAQHPALLTNTAESYNMHGAIIREIYTGDNNTLSSLNCISNQSNDSLAVSYKDVINDPIDNRIINMHSDGYSDINGIRGIAPCIFNDDMLTKNTYMFKNYGGKIMWASRAENSPDKQNYINNIIKNSNDNIFPAFRVVSEFKLHENDNSNWYIPMFKEIIYLTTRFYTIQHVCYMLLQIGVDAEPLSHDWDDFYWINEYYNAWWPYIIWADDLSIHKKWSLGTAGRIRPFKEL